MGSFGPTIQPGPNWTGNPGTGFVGNPPSDPERTTAKPVIRPLQPPNLWFTGAQTIGVWAAANNNGSLIDNLGLQKVIIYYEGNSYEILEPSMRTFSDINGITRSYLGWWATIGKPPSLSGHAHVYWEAVPRDITMQSRIIGPFQFSPQTALHDFEIEVAPSLPAITGQRYPSIAAATYYLVAQSAQNPLIKITEALTDQISSTWSGSIYNPNGHFTITATAPVLFEKPAPATGISNSFRTFIDGLWFKGKNITFDFKNAGNIYHENESHVQHVFEGINLIDSGGNYHLVNMGEKITLHCSRFHAYFLECHIDAVQEACQGASLVCGCLLENGNKDAATYAFCVVGNTIRNWTSGAQRTKINAISVQYGGAGATATLELSGGSGANSRTLTAKVDGIAVSSFTVLNTLAAYEANTNYTVQNVVGWLNSLSGWNARLLDNARAANLLSADTANALGGAFGPTDAKTSPLTLHTAIDEHADLWQHIGATENYIFAGNNCYNNWVQSLFLGDSPGVKDIVIVNNTFDIDETNPDALVSVSQIDGTQSHVVIAHNSWSNQSLKLRKDHAYNPDRYCLIANNVAPHIEWVGLPGAANLKMKDNHLFGGATNPLGATGTTSEGNKASLFVQPSQGNFHPQSGLLAYLKSPVLPYDSAGVESAMPAPAGALRG